MVKKKQRVPVPDLLKVHFIKKLWIAAFIFLVNFCSCILYKFQSFFWPTADQRILELVKNLARMYGTRNISFPGYKEIQITLSIRELADLSASKVAMVNKMFKKLERSGKIKFNGRLILVRQASF